MLIQRATERFLNSEHAFEAGYNYTFIQPHAKHKQFL
jgi:hypothetical protein